jgi:hypothetical protein
MSFELASTADGGKLQEPSSATAPGKAGSVKKPRSPKSSAGKARTRASLSAVKDQEGQPSQGNGDIHARIAERAFELYHRRGGHHGQDLEDWFAAEREVLVKDP